MYLRSNACAGPAAEGDVGGAVRRNIEHPLGEDGKRRRLAASILWPSDRNGVPGEKRVEKTSAGATGDA